MKFVLPFVFIMAAGNAPAQLKWTQHVPGFVFVIKADTVQYDSDPDYFRYEKISISICDQVTGEFIQGWKDLEVGGYSYMEKEGLVIMEDLNFDGYMDFRVRTIEYLNGAQTLHDCYLFIPQTRKFEFIESASALEGMDLIRSKKLIHTQWRYGFTSFGHAIYEWKGYELVPVLWIEEDWDGKWVTTRKMVNGVLTEVENDAGFSSELPPHNSCFMSDYKPFD